MGYNVDGYNLTGFDSNGQDVNGYTLDQQEAYREYYTVNTEYDPTQPILHADRNWGTIIETNNYLTSSNTVSQGPLHLGDFNLRWTEFNNFLPSPGAISEEQQQKLFLSVASLAVDTVTCLTKKSLEEFKRATIFLQGCNEPVLMKTFLKRAICDSVRSVIDGTIKRLPVRDEFLIHINEEGRPALKWMELSGYKLHRLIDLLIISIQGSDRTTYVEPIVEATKLALEFMNNFKYANLDQHTIDPMRTTEVIAQTKSNFGENNMRMNKWIKNPANSTALVFNILTDLKDKSHNALERERNAIIIRLFVMKGIMSNQFPTVKNTIGYWTLISNCEDILTQMAEAWRAVRIWAEPSLTLAMTMTEADLQKKLHHQCQKAPHTSVPRPNGGGHRPPGGGRGGQSSGSGRGTAHPIGQTDSSGFPKGYARHQSASSGAGTMNPFTARTLGIIRDMSGKQKTSST